MNENKKFELDPKEFGIQPPPYTPTGIVQGQGNLLRGVSAKGKKRSSAVRIIAIIISFFYLLLPGLFYLVLSVIGFRSGGFISFFSSFSIGLILTLGGIIGLYRNMR